MDPYINKIGFFFEKTGLNLTQGRILGLLLVCDPPYLNVSTIARELDLPKSTTSTTIARLKELGLVELAVVRGRGDFYQVSEHLWIQTLDGKADAATAFIHLANEGLHLLKDFPIDRKQRLLEMKLLFEFMETEMPKLMNKYREYRSQIIVDGQLPAE